jgi:DNA-directed RNA polymerase subunit omega
MGDWESRSATAGFKMPNSPENPHAKPLPTHHRALRGRLPPMRDEYLKAALLKVDDPNILVNLVSRRVKQLRRGHRALVVSLEKLSPEDIALREIIEGKISYELPTDEEMAARRG